MQVILILFISSISLLAFTHVVALEFYLYWTYLWLDIPMHLLGGFCVALGLASLPYFGIKLPSRFTTLLSFILAALIIGLAWGLFEFFNGISSMKESDFLFDTSLDLVLDMVGSALGYYLHTRLKHF